MKRSCLYIATKSNMEELIQNPDHLVDGLVMSLVDMTIHVTLQAFRITGLSKLLDFVVIYL